MKAAAHTTHEVTLTYKIVANGRYCSRKCKHLNSYSECGLFRHNDKWSSARSLRQLGGSSIRCTRCLSATLTAADKAVAK